MRPVLRCCLAFGILLPLLTGGCALRATTDFGPGDEPHHQSAGAGAGPFPDLYRSDGQRTAGQEAAAPPDTGAEAPEGGRPL